MDHQVGHRLLIDMLVVVEVPVVKVDQDLDRTLMKDLEELVLVDMALVLIGFQQIMEHLGQTDH
jgi:hypothetical protein